MDNLIVFRLSFVSPLIRRHSSIIWRKLERGAHCLTVCLIQILNFVDDDRHGQLIDSHSKVAHTRPVLKPLVNVLSRKNDLTFFGTPHFLVRQSLCERMYYIYQLVNVRRGIHGNDPESSFLLIGTYLSFIRI